MKKCFSMLCAVMILGLASRPPSFAADNVLDVVPNNALAVVVVNNLEQTADQLADTAGKLQIPAMNVLALAKLQTGISEGLNDQGRLGFAVVPAASGAPTFLVAVPATDFQALIKPFQPENPGDEIVRVSILGARAVVASKGGFAIGCMAKDEAVLKQALAAPPLADDVKQLQPWLAEQQAYGLATPAGIKVAQAQVLAGLAEARRQLEGQGDQAKIAAAGLGIYESIFRAIDKEITYCAVGAQIRDDGSVHLRSHSLLAEGGRLAAIGAGIGEAVGDPLQNLPQGPFVFAGGGVYPSNVAEELMSLSMRMIQVLPGSEQIPDEELEKLLEISADSVRGLRSMGMIIGVGEEGTALYSDTIITMQVDNARRYMKTYARAIKELGEISGENSFMKFDVSQVEIEGRQAFEIKMDMRSMIPGVPDPKTQEMMESMFGKNGVLAIYLAAANKNTIVGAYVSPEHLTQAIKSIKSRQPQLSDDPAVAKTLGLLPEGSQWVALWSPQGTRELVARMISGVVPDVVTQIPEVDACSPVGVSVKISGESLDTAIVVPLDTLQAIGKFIQQVTTGARNVVRGY